MSFGRELVYKVSVVSRKWGRSFWREIVRDISVFFWLREEQKLALYPRIVTSTILILVLW